MGLFSSLFSNAEPRWPSSASMMMQRVGSKYNNIIQYFVQHPWGESNLDIKIVNSLPSPDRAIVIEDLFKIKAYEDINKITLSLTVAYFWVGFGYYNDFIRWSRPFADSCYKRELITSSQHDILIAKIRDLALTPSASSYNSYATVKGNLEDYAPDCKLRDLAIDICANAGTTGIMIPFTSAFPEPVRHPNYEQDLKDFALDRDCFLEALQL